jgi:hypothetical protein
MQTTPAIEQTQDALLGGIPVPFSGGGVEQLDTPNNVVHSFHDAKDNVLAEITIPNDPNGLESPSISIPLKDGEVIQMIAPKNEGGQPQFVWTQIRDGKSDSVATDRKSFESLLRTSPLTQEDPLYAQKIADTIKQYEDDFQFINASPSTIPTTPVTPEKTQHIRAVTDRNNNSLLEVKAGTVQNTTLYCADGKSIENPAVPLYPDATHTIALAGATNAKLSPIPNVPADKMAAIVTGLKEGNVTISASRTDDPFAVCQAKIPATVASYTPPRGGRQ